VSPHELTVLGRALLAAVVGFVIGWERESAGAAAGDRTFALVSMAAAVLTALSLTMFPASADRVVAGIVTGIGFLGGGMIMRRASGEVRGLTTAAGLWAATSIGVVVGAGYYWLAVVLTLLVLLVLHWNEIPLVRRLGLAHARPHAGDPRALPGPRAKRSGGRG
jgi:putative Mg2+ transporter-C (MgtC) family protein